MTAEPPAVGSWQDQQLRQALARVEALTREVTLLRDALRVQQQDAERLHEAVATVEGRTRRHEAGQDLGRALQQQFGELAERLEQEMAQRRDQGAEARRGIEAERAQQQAVQQALMALDQRLALMELAMPPIGERQRHLSSDLADRAREEQSFEEELTATAHRMDALAEATRREAQQQARVLDAVPGLRAATEALEARTGALLQEQRRLEQEVAALRSTHSDERSAEDLLEQVRSLRERVEERLGRLERRLDEALESQAAAVEARALLARQIAAIHERVEALAASFEGQRDALLDHFRRDAAVADELGRRQAEELDRQSRARRDLLVRLGEASDQATREQPL